MAFDTIIKSIEIANNILSGLAALIVIFLFYSKRKTISSIVHLLLNYNCHITLAELHAKLDKLMYLNADDKKEKIEIINIINEIEGQIKGNPFLIKKCDEIIKVISKYVAKPDMLNEPMKRNMIWEIRENIRYINIKLYVKYER